MKKFVFAAKAAVRNLNSVCNSNIWKALLFLLLAALPVAVLVGAAIVVPGLGNKIALSLGATGCLAIAVRQAATATRYGELLFAASLFGWMTATIFAAGALLISGSEAAEPWTLTAAGGLLLSIPANVGQALKSEKQTLVAWFVLFGGCLMSALGVMCLLQAAVVAFGAKPELAMTILLWAMGICFSGLLFTLTMMLVQTFKEAKNLFETALGFAAVCLGSGAWLGLTAAMLEGAGLSLNLAETIGGVIFLIGAAIMAIILVIAALDATWRRLCRR